MQRTVLQTIFTLATCAMLGNAGAANVYKWVDADGITHYSDAPPDAIETMLIDLPEPIPASTAGEPEADSDYYSITRQWERMNRERLEREKLEVERARIRAAKKASQPPPIYVQQTDDVRYVPIYHRYGYRKDRRYRHHYSRPAIESYSPASTLTGSWPTQ
jgi:hypothetical protein